MCISWTTKCLKVCEADFISVNVENGVTIKKEISFIRMTTQDMRLPCFLFINA